MKPTQSILILLSLFLMFSCDDNDNLTTHSSEIEVDWVLVKSTNMTIEVPIDTVYDFFGDIIYVEEENITNIGYRLFFTHSSGINIEEETVENNNGILSFNYNEETYTYDLSNSYNQEYNVYFFKIYTYDDLDPDNIYCDRIILNTESNYMTYFVSGGWGGEFNLSTPNELIDYR